MPSKISDEYESMRSTIAAGRQRVVAIRDRLLGELADAKAVRMATEQGTPERAAAIGEERFVMRKLSRVAKWLDAASRKIAHMREAIAQQGVDAETARPKMRPRTRPD
jgi:hypothetical protein